VEELPGRASSGRASVLATWRAGGRGGPRSSRRSVAMQCRTRHWGRVFSPWPARAAVGKRGTGCAPGLPRPGRPGSTAFVSRVGNRSKRWQRGSSHLGAGARRMAKSGPSPEARSALGSRRISRISSRISRISSRISRTSRISRVIISRGQQVVWVEVVRGVGRVSSFALTRGAGARSGPRAAPRLRCPRRSSISVPLLDLALLLLAWPH
jgi:hypothetical protein